MGRGWDDAILPESFLDGMSFWLVLARLGSLGAGALFEFSDPAWPTLNVDCFDRASWRDLAFWLVLFRLGNLGISIKLSELFDPA